MKRIRYVCDECGAEKKESFQNWDTPPARIRCVVCHIDRAMAARPPNPANHFRPTKGKG